MRYLGPLEIYRAVWLFALRIFWAKITALQQHRFHIFYGRQPCLFLQNDLLETFVRHLGAAIIVGTLYAPPVNPSPAAPKPKSHGCAGWIVKKPRATTESRASTFCLKSWADGYSLIQRQMVRKYEQTPCETPTDQSDHGFQAIQDPAGLDGLDGLVSMVRVHVACSTIVSSSSQTLKHAITCNYCI